MFETISDIQHYLDEHKTSVFDLDAIRALMRVLGNPQHAFKAVHITGTNGKGSTGAYIINILKSAGYKVGSFSSPAVFYRNEIIKIDDEPITDTDYISLFNKVYIAVEAVIASGSRQPTAFEIETAMAYLYFAESNVDIAVVEVGMGGELDSTNVLENTMVEVITHISYDHMSVLGSTLADIARVKAGIVKPHSTLITTTQDDDVMRVLRARANDTMSRMIVAGEGVKIGDTETEQVIAYKGREYLSALLGEYQTHNMPMAIECVRELKRRGMTLINDRAISEGIERTRLHGRFEYIGGRPTFILDGAHNDDASRKLHESIMHYYEDRRIVYIIGIFRDKDYKRIIDNTIDLASEVITFDWDNVRHMSGVELRDILEGRADVVKYAGDAIGAVKMALEDTCEDDVIVAFGSLSHLREIYDAYHTCKGDNNG